jgi:hypothetical protein
MGFMFKFNVDFENKEFQIVRITREGIFNNSENVSTEYEI